MPLQLQAALAHVVSVYFSMSGRVAATLGLFCKLICKIQYLNRDSDFLCGKTWLELEI